MIDLRKIKYSIGVLLAMAGLFIFCISRIFAQNLVINGSFEAPGGVGGAAGVDGNYWYINGTDVPTNVFGYSDPCSGVAYAVIHQTTTTPPDFSWMTFQLVQPINPGDTVVVGMCISLAEYGAFKTNTLSGIFGDISLTLGGEPNQILPMVSFQSTLADTSGWIQVSDTFISTGTGAFDYFSLYFFNDFGSIQIVNPAGSPHGAYYFIDDVSIQKVTQTQTGPFVPQIINLEGRPITEVTSGLQFRIYYENGEYRTKKVLVID